MEHSVAVSSSIADGVSSDLDDSNNIQSVTSI